MKKASTILCVLILALATISCSSNTPTGVAEKAMKCIQNKNWEGYVDLIHLSDEGKASEESLKNEKMILTALTSETISKDLEKKGGIKSFETIEEEISEDGNKAKVTIEVNYGNGSSKKDTTKLCKDKDGNWKLDLGK